MTAASALWPDSLYGRPGRAEGDGEPVLRSRAGEVVVLHQRRWHDRPAPEEHGLLARARGRVLDIGCGPGRHVLDLVRRGHDALGIDTSAAAVALANRRGAPAIRRSVFGPVPDAGRWDSALLLDGNIGIGGDADTLLRRVGRLVRPSGLVLVEIDGPDVGGGRLEVRVEHDGRHGRWFAWARVSLRDLDAHAAASGLRVEQAWQARSRWFADLRPAGQSRR